jgi:hypothetical protein
MSSNIAQLTAAAVREVTALTRRRDHPMPDDDSSAQDDKDLVRTTSIVLAEFAGLRSEIATRVNLQFTLILGNLTVLGVVLGIGLSRPDNKSILLLLPIVTPCIGLLVIDQYRLLSILSQYIYTVVRPQLHITSRANGVEVFAWEQWIMGQLFDPWLFIPPQLVLALEFFGPSVGVLIAAWQYHLHHPQEQVTALQQWLWWGGTILTIGLFLYALAYGTYSYWHPRGVRRSRTSPKKQ